MKRTTTPTEETQTMNMSDTAARIANGATVEEALAYDPTPVALKTLTSFTKAHQRHMAKIARGERSKPTSKASKHRAYAAASQIARHNGYEPRHPQSFNDLLAIERQTRSAS